MKLHRDTEYSNIRVYKIVLKWPTAGEAVRILVAWNMPGVPAIKVPPLDLGRSPGYLYSLFATYICAPVKYFLSRLYIH